MSGPSDKANLRAADAHRDLAPRTLVLSILCTAHDPALGLDRSVCLRDVVERVRDAPSTWTHHGGQGIADFLEREFGGSDAS